MKDVPDYERRENTYSQLDKVKEAEAVAGEE